MTTQVSAGQFLTWNELGEAYGGVCTLLELRHLVGPHLAPRDVHRELRWDVRTLSSQTHTQKRDVSTTLGKSPPLVLRGCRKQMSV